MSLSNFPDRIRHPQDQKHQEIFPCLSPPQTQRTNQLISTHIILSNLGVSHKWIIQKPDSREYISQSVQDLFLCVLQPKHMVSSAMECYHLVVTSNTSRTSLTTNSWDYPLLVLRFSFNNLCLLGATQSTHSRYPPSKLLLK